MGEESDELVWHRVRAGETRAFGVIWDRHHSRVFRYLVGVSSDASEAEDLTATVFLELWRRRGSVRFVDGSALPWLIVTGQNVSRNSARARHRYRRFLSALPAPQPMPDHADSIADRNDARAALLREELAGLRPADAQLLTLTALEGFTIREAAVAVGISESAAKMRLSRLRARLSQAVHAASLIEENI